MLSVVSIPSIEFSKNYMTYITSTTLNGPWASAGLSWEGKDLGWSPEIEVPENLPESFIVPAREDAKHPGHYVPRYNPGFDELYSHLEERPFEDGEIRKLIKMLEMRIFNES